MAQLWYGAPFKIAQPYRGARGKKIGWAEAQCKSRLSTKNYKPRATESLRHLMLKLFCAILLSAPNRLNYSKPSMDEDGTEPSHPPCETNRNKHHKCLTGKQMFQYMYFNSINIEPFLKRLCPHLQRGQGGTKGKF